MTTNLNPFQKTSTKQLESQLENRSNEMFSKKLNKDNTSTLQECMYCEEMVEENERDEHNQLCLELDKFIDEKTCLICDIDFDTTSKVANHIRKEHLSLIGIQKGQVENVQIAKKQSIKVEHSQEMIDLENLSMETDPLALEPSEMTRNFTCPMCGKKYLILSDVENHLSSFHRIAKKVQKILMQGDKSVAIIKESM